jgi:hypothetical protein
MTTKTLRPASLRPGHVIVATESAAKFWGIEPGTALAKVVTKPFRSEGMVVVLVESLGATGSDYAARVGERYESPFGPRAAVLVQA